MPRIPYDEFSFFLENITEWNLDVSIPPVERRRLEVEPGRAVSALFWGPGDPRLALVHGGAQNAHTFDTVALALQEPLVAFDLPGHGHSDAGPFGNTAVAQHALDIARALSQASATPLPLVGMSLGGLTSLVVARDHPALITSLVLIDITPGVNAEKAKHITSFVNGPTSFADFDALLQRTIEHNPTRSVSSLRRGILHNAVQQDDGTWMWRHQRHPRSELTAPEVGNLWDALSSLDMPVTLVRGMAAGSVVDDEDEKEFLRRQPHGRVIHVEGAGHSVQGDAPLQLAQILADVI